MTTNMGTHRNEKRVLANTFILKPLAQAADSNARCFTHTSIWIAKANLDDGPYLVHQGSHIFAAPFDSDAKGKHGTPTRTSIRRREVLAN